MVTHSRAAGFALLECLFAMLVLTVLAASLFAGERGGAWAARRSMEENLVTWTLDARLDALRAMPAIAAGETVVTAPARDVELAGERLVERIAEIEPGLFEVELELSWTPLGATAPVVRNVVTRLAKGAPR